MSVLEGAGLTLVKINCEEAFPDCVFVEDTAIAVDNAVFITNLAAASRHGETDQIERVFREYKSLRVGGVKNRDEAFIDGGDCLFTGREFIVGISSRTNEKGSILRFK